MSEAIQEREGQVAWRITQIAILAFITFFVISITDKDSDDTTYELQDSTLVNAEIQDEQTVITNEVQIATSSILEDTKSPRTFTFVATG